MMSFSSAAIYNPGGGSLYILVISLCRKQSPINVVNMSLICSVLVVVDICQEESVLTLESWYTNLEQTPLNRGHQLPTKKTENKNRTSYYFIDESKLKHQSALKIPTCTLQPITLWQN